MTPRAAGRTETCTPAQARTRLAQAEKFAEIADLVLDEQVDTAPGVAAALSVLAGIAASDATCGAALGRRSRGQDHRQAVDLLLTVAPDGVTMAKALRELLDVKDASHYAPVLLTRKQGQAAVRRAAGLVLAARRHVR